MSTKRRLKLFASKIQQSQEAGQQGGDPDKSMRSNLKVDVACGVCVVLARCNLLALSLPKHVGKIQIEEVGGGIR